MFNAGDIQGSLTLDRSPFQRGLAQARRDAERFERQRIKPTLDAEDRPAQRKLNGLWADMRRLARERTVPKIHVDTTPAKRGVRQVKRDLVSIRDEHVTVHVNVDRFRSGLDGTLRALGSWKVAAVASIVAIAPAAVAAAGAIGGIGVAALATLPAFGLLGLGMVRAFKAGGPVIRELKREFEALTLSFGRMSRPGAHAAFKGLVDAMHSLRHVVPMLKADFTALGEAVGGMFRELGEHMETPRMGQFFQTMLQGTTGAVAPLTRILKSLLNVLANITEAAMPLFIRSLEQLATWLGRMGEKTNDIGKLRASMDRGAAAAGKFWQIVKNLSSILGSIWQVGQKPSADLLAAFEKGTRALADFFKTAEGREILRKTLESMVLFAEELLKALPTLIELFGGLLDVGRFLWKVVVGILDVVKQIPLVGPGIAALALGWAAWLGPIGLVRVALGGLFTILGRVLGRLRRVRAPAGVVAGGVVAGGGRGGRGGRAAPGRSTTPIPAVFTRGATQQATQQARTAGTTVARAGFIAGLVAAIATGRARVVGAIRGLLSRAGRLFRRIPGVAAVAGIIGGAFAKARGRVIRAVRGIPRTVGRLLRRIPGLGAIAGIVGAGFARAVPRVMNIVRKIGPRAGSILKGAGRLVVRGVAGWPGMIAYLIWSLLPGKLKATIIRVIKASSPAFTDAGKNLMRALANGIKAAGSWAYNAAKDVLRKVRDILPFSEPRDPSSPLYGLGKAGEAIIENVARGIARKRGLIGAQLREELARASKELNEKMHAMAIKAAEMAYAPTRTAFAAELGAWEARDRAREGPPLTRGQQEAAIMQRIQTAGQAVDERGVPIHARPPGVARVHSRAELDLIAELRELREAFRREDLEAAVNIDISAMVPSDPAVLRQIQRSLGRSVRQGRRRRPRRARMA